MIRELFHIGPLSISPFGVMLVLAFLSSYLQLRRGLQLQEIGDDEDASTMVFWAGLGGILGGKIYYAILYGDWRLLFDRAGIVWYGGLIGGALMVLLTLRRRELPLLKTLDAAGPALALGYAVGRVGCLLVGDDYGRPTDLPWGLSFKEGLPPTTAGYLRDQFGVDLPGSIADSELIAVHPTQLYETLGGLLICGITWGLLRRKVARPGLVFLLTLALLSCERFAVEFVRLKDDRFLGPLTVAQAISLALLVLVLFLSWRLRPWRRESA